VKVYDPVAMRNAVEVTSQLTYAGSALEAARDADAVLVATAWPELASISPLPTKAVSASMTVMDACQGIDSSTWRGAGWKVLSLRTSWSRRPHRHRLIQDGRLADYRSDRRIQDREVIGRDVDPALLRRISPASGCRVLLPGLFGVGPLAGGFTCPS
jgi:UDP-glucose/GDP-mannose dehydrogenase family, UDP binding domain